MRQLAMATVLFFSMRAWAQDAFSLQNFRPAVDSKGLVVTNSSQTLNHLDFSVGLVGSYAYRSLALQNDGVTFDVDHLVTMQLQGAIGLFGGERWRDRLHGVGFELGFTLPVSILSGRRSLALPTPSTRLDFSGQSVGDVGLNLKARFLDGTSHWLGVAVLLAVDFPSGKSSAFLGEGQTTFRPQLILDKGFGRTRRFRLALDLGALVRPSKHTFTDADTALSRALGSQLTYSVGASYAIVPQRFDLVGEIFGAHDLTGERSGNPVELLAAAKVYLAASSYFEIGASAGLLSPRIIGGQENMTGQPEARAFLGFIFEPKIGGHDRRGIEDAEEPPRPAPPKPTPPPEPAPEKTLVQRREGRIVTFEKVYFKTASAEILPRSFALLDALVSLLNDAKDIDLLEIAGHADERGNDDYNLRLTEARAQSVRRYLVEHGVEGSRLSAHGYGEQQPAPDPGTDHLCTAHTEHCWDTNRRVEFRILLP